MTDLAEWPDRLPGYIWMPDDGDFSSQKTPPTGIVIHSGSRSPNVAEYAENEPDGRKISYHLAWSSEHEHLVQMVSLRDRAWHAGRTPIPGTACKGNDWLGIALPGPYDSPRSDWERACLRLAVQSLQDVFGGTLEYWTRHSDIKRSKRDPGPGFTDSWMSGLGLQWVGRA